jgi:hypothetical protein
MVSPRARWVASVRDHRPLPVLAKTLLRDVLDDLDAASISGPDRLEGLAVAADGQVYLADKDGVDENYAETIFLRLGLAEDAFTESKRSKASSPARR